MKFYHYLGLAALLASALGAVAQAPDQSPDQAPDQAAEPPPEEPEAEARASGPVIELQSRVTGNREQPQVFHVVPWQNPDSPIPDYNPLERQLDSVFGHIERDELRRELKQRGDWPTEEP